MKDFCEKEGIDPEFFKTYYYFIISLIRAEIKKPEIISYYFKGLGTLFMTLTGCNYEIMRAESAMSKGYNSSKLYNKYTQRLPYIKAHIKYVMKHVKKIRWLDKIFNPRGIKNKGYEQKD